MTNKLIKRRKNLVPVAKFLTLQRKQANPLLTEAKRLAKIKMIINQSLDSQISQHVEVAKASNNTLVLVTDSPVWATRVRYMQNQILSQLRKFAISKTLYKLSVKVRPMELGTRQSKQRKNDMYLSKQTAQAMEQEIESIQDPALKAALMRLTKRAR